WNSLGGRGPDCHTGGETTSSSSLRFVASLREYAGRECFRCAMAFHSAMKSMEKDLRAVFVERGGERSRRRTRRCLSSSDAFLRTRADILTTCVGNLTAWADILTAWAHIQIARA